MAFEIKRNDRRPRYRLQLTANGDPVNLAGATAIRFTMKSTGATKIDKAAMTIIDSINGIVEYAWVGTDTDTEGDYNVEVEVDWGGGDLQTFPTNGYFTCKINPDLA